MWGRGDFIDNVLCVLNGLIRGQFWSRRLSVLRRWFNRRHHINAVTADGCNANSDDGNCCNASTDADENDTEFISDTSDGHLHCDEDSMISYG